MNDVTQILSRIESGDPAAAEQLLPLVYEELRKLAALRLARENPGQTLQATALVHEAYLRLVDGQQDQNWNSRGHFFGAAAEAMRRILIENARRKCSQKHGGGLQRVSLEDQTANKETPEQYLVIDEALTDLEKLDSKAGQLFKLRYFTGCSIEEAGDILGIPRATAYRDWSFGRAWILKRLLTDQ